MTTTSREYAEALFELAVQGNVTEETSEGLETVISALMQTPEYRALLELNDVGRSSAAGFMQSLLGFVLVLTANMLVSRIDKQSALF